MPAMCGCRNGRGFYVQNRRGVFATLPTDGKPCWRDHIGRLSFSAEVNRMMQWSESDVESLRAECEAKIPEEIIERALRAADGGVAVSFSGAEDVVLVHMAVQVDKKVRVFSLDTGRLHPETYRFIDKVRARYELELEILVPDAPALESLVRKKGLFSFYEDGHTECCGIRKVAPLRRQLQSLTAWITGQRRDQSPNTRADVPVVEIDRNFSTADRALLKFNPLANWSSSQVWDYIRENDLPFNELHLKGFTSIGCEPCTRPILPNQHEREGRWWWEEATKKECGLHARP
jgi:phosphoadenosine phosphosulfate reductase